MLLPRRRNFFIILCFILLFFISHRFFSIGFSAISTMSSYILYPVLRIQQLITGPIRAWLERRARINSIETKLHKVQKERDEFIAQIVEMRATQRYATEIDELIHYKQRFTNKNVRIASVLVRHFSEQTHFILVDGGSKHGIAKDMIAVHNNCLVGKVTEVYPWYCKVSLITDTTCKVAALCAQTGASGIHEGKNNEHLTMVNYISHLEKMEPGDIVLSSGEGLIFPSGFALGKIYSVERGELFYDVKVKPLIDFRFLRHCLLVAKSDIT